MTSTICTTQLLIEAVIHDVEAHIITLNDGIRILRRHANKINDPIFDGGIMLTISMLKAVSGE